MCEYVYTVYTPNRMQNVWAVETIQKQSETKRNERLWQWYNYSVFIRFVNVLVSLYSRSSFTLILFWMCLYIEYMCEIHYLCLCMWIVNTTHCSSHSFYFFVLSKTIIFFVEMLESSTVLFISQLHIGSCQLSYQCQAIEFE